MASPNYGSYYSNLLSQTSTPQQPPQPQQVQMPMQPQTQQPYRPPSAPQTPHKPVPSSSSALFSVHEHHAPHHQSHMNARLDLSHRIPQTPDEIAHSQYVKSYHYQPEYYDHPGLGRHVGPNDFEKIRLLGKGDVGRVYLVREKMSGNLYAMKILLKKELIKRHKVDRIMTEKHALAAANHPFVITLYHSFQSAEKLFFVISYCAGGEFFRMLQTQPNGRLPEHVVCYYTAEVALALEYLHLMGFVYRDLKPENLLLHSSGHIKVADFDLSKEILPHQSIQPTVCLHAEIKKVYDPIVATKPTLHKTTSFVGTVEYIAPEVVRGHGHDASLDWWTFGIFVHELIFGSTPFKGASRDETFANIVSKKLVFPENVQTSPECKHLIKKLLKKDSSQRLGSKYGAAEIKAHPFFKEINWALIRNETPPIDPIISHPLDTSHFTPVVDDMPVDFNKEILMEDATEPTGYFRQFTYHRQVASNTYCDAPPLKAT